MGVQDRHLELKALSQQINVKQEQLTSLANKTNTIRKDQAMLNRQNKELKQQITINKQELKTLKRRVDPTEPEDLAALEEAVRDQIIKRRKTSTSLDFPISLNELRALDRSNISQILKEVKPLLTSWDQILARCLGRLHSDRFTNLKSVDDFIDGIQIRAPDDLPW